MKAQQLADEADRAPVGKQVATKNGQQLVGLEKRMEGGEDEHALGALTAPGVFLEPAVAAFEHRKILGITGKQAGDLQFVQGPQELK